MNNQQIESCLKFLHRTDLKGAEASEWVDVVSGLLALANANAARDLAPPDANAVRTPPKSMRGVLSEPPAPPAGDHEGEHA